MFRNKFMKKQMLYVIALLAVFGAQSIFAQTTAFTYQGKLNDGGNPANAGYDMQFRLFDMAGAGQGTQQGATITNPTVAVTNGNFAVSLDFGSAVFASGADRFLEISLRPAGNTGGYTSLAPRQKLTSSPYSVRSINANSADALSTACVGCVQNSNINSVDGTKVTGTVANATTATTATNANNSNQLGNLPSNRFVQLDVNGDVSIGTTSTGSKLTVAGVIESTTGGIKFPDTTVQTTAGLTAVTTDATLTGNGTANTPLGIASPLLVRDTDNPALQPFQASTTVTGVFVTVPAGKILVIEFVAGYQVVPSPYGFGLELLIPSVNAFYYIAPQNISFVANNYWHNYSQQTRIYLTAGQQLRVNWNTISSSRYLSISGYLVNAPK